MVQTSFGPNQMSTATGAADVSAEQRRGIGRNLAIFTIVVLSVGFIGRWLDLSAGTPAGQEGPGILIWLVVPSLTALLLRAFAGDGWKDFGIRARFRAQARWYLLALLVYPVLTSFTIAVGVMTGFVGTPTFTLGIINAMAQVFLISLVPQLLKNVFEETAWRGYLAPRVYALGATGSGGHLLVGFIWGAWHIPYYLYFLDRATLAEFTTLPLAVFIAMAIVTMMAWALVYGELYLITQSIWPVVLMHAVEDAFLNQLFTDGHLAISPGADWLFSPVNGVLGMVLFVTLGIALNRWRQHQEPIVGNSLSSNP
jgi:hypothetical protein